MADRHSVLFVCVKNGGKSQMAAALMRHRAGESIEVHSAGTHPGDAVNGLSAQVIEESGGSMADQHPKLIDEGLLRRVDRVVVLGSEATVDPIEGMAGSIEVWSTDEPSARGIDGIERMRLIRDDIADRIDALIAELTGPAVPVVRVYEPALCCNTGSVGPNWTTTSSDSPPTWTTCKTRVPISNGTTWPMTRPRSPRTRQSQTSCASQDQPVCR